MNQKSFGQVLREIRRESDKTIDDVVNFMNWGKAYLMDIEMGRSSPPNIDKLLMLCDFFKIQDPITFVTLAFKDKKQFTLDLSANPSNKEVAKTAAMLARQWNELPEKKLKKIQKILLEED